ncbi:RHS repeat-associated core domain-containing protein [Pelagibius sp. CAU 1746]|uniref:golvesin C-terminal-like domain-containing protein n=1 Tax=Pelagibius sp. CAU 1746 TaxID=3140370 RepID=UPI00325B00DC
MAALRTASWTYSPAESGDYRVFARWPKGEGHATNAPYTVQHDGGSSLVTVSQAQRGGQWNELGVFTFTGGQDYAVTLSDDANGTVVADALYIVKVEPLSDAVTWAPSLPAGGTYQVYAKWTADETRSTDASYSIVHSGGTAAVTVNQRVGGGLWHYLGSYAFDPLSNPTVTLAANDNGSVAADAIRFVGGPGGATDIAYLHNDHLGTPQVMTDASAQVLWWRDQTPFGQTVTAGGFSQSPLRFPGQIADAESGLAYNYFRDYDPALGRYIQSDPIGLGGGLNTYGYVGGAPLRYVDLYGLREYPDDFFGPLPENGYFKSEMTWTRCGNIPPAPPGADVNANMQEADDSWDPFWFYNQVRNGGPWDYKQQGRKYEDFGNFNFGASGSAFGFPEGVLRRGAGWANQKADPTRKGLGDPLGGPPYGDDPADQEQIGKGINYCECMEY